ncbi:MAG: GNAT family N-acetyltransferase [Bacteroidota bacterium]
MFNDPSSIQQGVQQMETNLYGLYQLLAETFGGTGQSEDSVRWVMDAGLVWPRTVYGTPSSGLDLPAIVARMKQNTIPPYWIFCLEKTTELHQQLLDHGFRHMARWPGMAIQLGKQEVPQLSPTITAGRLTQLSSLEAWGKVVNANLMKTTPLTMTVLKRWWQQFPDLHFYGVQVKGELVTTALAYPRDGGVGLYLFSTAHQHRRQGYTRLLMQQLLADYQQLGCTHAFLQASREGALAYPKMGFQTICHFDIYWLLGVK